MATQANANLPDDPNDPLAPRPRADDVPAQVSADGDLLIHAIGLHSYYGASHILRGIDFAVRRGETVGYTSVRRKPSRSKIDAAIAQYAQMKQDEEA